MTVFASKIEVKVQDFLLEVAKGNIPGHSSVIIAASNLSVGTSMETLWKSTGIWVPLTTPQTMTITSDSPDDTLLGTGAQILLLEGLDASGNPQSEPVNMNGTGNVVTSLIWSGINPSIITAGDDRTNAGLITVIGTVDATLQSVMEVGDSVTSVLIYHIAVNCRLFFKQIRTQVFKSSGGSADVQTFGYTSANGTDYKIYEVDTQENVNPSDILTLAGWTRAEGQGYAYFEAVSSSNNTIVRAALEAVLVQDGF